MCVCPVAVAPPAILALHAPARHAVARIMHRAANRLDHKADAVGEYRPVAELPCAPSIAGGTGLPVSGGDVIGDIGGDGQLAAVPLVPTTLASNGYADRNERGGYGVGIGGIGGGGFIGGGGGGEGGDARQPPAPLTHQALPVSAVSGAPEPAAWVFLVTGFGLVGAIARRRSGVVRVEPSSK